MMIGAKDNETLILLPTLATITSSYGYVYQNFAHIFSFGNSSDRDAYWYNFWIESFEAQALQACSFLTVIVGNLHNSLSYSLQVNHRLPSSLSSL